MSHRILLVEDNPDHVDLILRVLKKNKLLNEIVIARDGEEALDYIFCRGKYEDRNKYEFPHLILLDLKMPKVDGFEVLKAIRANQSTKNLPVAILTTSSEEEDRTRCYSLGANSFIRKPVVFEEFKEVVNLLGLYWFEINIAP